ncbi:hypothetical protein NAF17_17650 [Mucilaginibacter sp. RB4R14]|nr:hypothetical protein [Mucilaginibacter aurantiaciroseus]MCO5937376.1 hypothetical protein [Mucilaginibacter aurantiaciroseus]
MKAKKIVKNKKKLLQMKEDNSYNASIVSPDLNIHALINESQYLSI